MNRNHLQCHIVFVDITIEYSNEIYYYIVTFINYKHLLCLQVRKSFLPTLAFINLSLFTTGSPLQIQFPRKTCIVCFIDIDYKINQIL